MRILAEDATQAVSCYRELRGRRRDASERLTRHKGGFTGVMDPGLPVPAAGRGIWAHDGRGQGRSNSDG